MNVLDERKKAILSSVIQDYILTAEPVGSRRLVERYYFPISSATIRNELALLEEMGYLEQPHTSAGRIPTDKGYRFYVDSLLENQNLSLREQRWIHHFFEVFNLEIEELMRETSQLLSKITSYAALVFAPDPRKDKVKHLDLVILSPHSLLIVLIAKAGSVFKKVLDIKAKVEPDELRRLEIYLNEHLEGLSVEEISALELSDDFFQDKALLRSILDVIIDCLQEEYGERVFYDGASNLLLQPEFDSLEKVQKLLETLEEGYQFLELFSEIAQKYRFVVKIGSENEGLSIDGCSLIAASYEVHGESLGAIGILGPTRMDYARTIPAVRFIAKNLGDVLEKVHD